MRDSNLLRWALVIAASSTVALAWAAARPGLHDGHPGHDHGHARARFDHDSPGEAGAYPTPASAGAEHHWFKGNLHTHTLWSDGDSFPEVVTRWYVEHGYHFLALSDHNVLQRGLRWIDVARGERRAALELYRSRFGAAWVETRSDDAGGLEVRLKPLAEFRHLFERAGRFLLIEAEEITEGNHKVHVNAANVLELIQPRTGASVEETIRLNIEAVLEQSAAHGRPMLPHLNHPNWQWAVTAEDMVPVASLRFFEVYNGHRGVNNQGSGERAGLERIWDIVLTRRLAEYGLGPVLGLAVDDAHHYEGSTSEVARPGRGWVMVRSRFLTPEHIVRALWEGDFYSTTGVSLRSIERDAGSLAVEVEPEQGVGYTIEFLGTRRGYDPASEPVRGATGEILRTTRRYSADIGVVLQRSEGASARYELQGDELYVRARVTSSKLHPNPFAPGEREQAWVQPLVPGP